MRVTEKGQVTIPKLIRDTLGIEPGAEVEFVLREGNVVHFEKVREAHKLSREEMMAHFEAIRGTLDLGGMTTDEFMDEVRGPRDDLDPR